MVDSESRGLGSRPCRVCSTAKQCTLKVPLSTKEGKWESTGELSRERDEMLRGGGGREGKKGKKGRITSIPSLGSEYTFGRFSKIGISFSSLGVEDLPYLTVFW